MVNVVLIHCNLRNIRKRNGLSQTRLGELVGLTKNAIWLIETGRVVPNVSTVVALCNVLGCTFSELIYVYSDDNKRVCL